MPATSDTGFSPDMQISYTLTLIHKKKGKQHVSKLKIRPKVQFFIKMQGMKRQMISQSWSKVSLEIQFQPSLHSLGVLSHSHFQ